MTPTRPKDSTDLGRTFLGWSEGLYPGWRFVLKMFVVVTILNAEKGARVDALAVGLLVPLFESSAAPAVDTAVSAVANNGTSRKILLFNIEIIASSLVSVFGSRGSGH